VFFYFSPRLFQDKDTSVQYFGLVLRFKIPTEFMLNKTRRSPTEKNVSFEESGVRPTQPRAEKKFVAHNVWLFAHGSPVSSRKLCVFVAVEVIPDYNYVAS
jgi:hypothetical protein